MKVEKLSALCQLNSLLKVFTIEVEDSIKKSDEQEILPISKELFNSLQQRFEASSFLNSKSFFDIVLSKEIPEAIKKNSNSNKIWKKIRQHFTKALNDPKHSLVIREIEKTSCLAYPNFGPITVQSFGKKNEDPKYQKFFQKKDEWKCGNWSGTLHYLIGYSVNYHSMNIKCSISEDKKPIFHVEFFEDKFSDKTPNKVFQKFCSHYLLVIPSTMDGMEVFGFKNEAICTQMQEIFENPKPTKKTPLKNFKNLLSSVTINSDSQSKKRKREFDNENDEKTSKKAENETQKPKPTATIILNGSKSKKSSTATPQIPEKDSKKAETPSKKRKIDPNGTSTKMEIEPEEEDVEEESEDDAEDAEFQEEESSSSDSSTSEPQYPTRFQLKKKKEQEEKEKQLKEAQNATNTKKVEEEEPKKAPKPEEEDDEDTPSPQKESLSSIAKQFLTKEISSILRESKKKEEAAEQEEESNKKNKKKQKKQKEPEKENDSPTKQILEDKFQKIAEKIEKIEEQAKTVIEKEKEKLNEFEKAIQTQKVEKPEKKPKNKTSEPEKPKEAEKKEEKEADTPKKVAFGPEKSKKSSKNQKILEKFKELLKSEEGEARNEPKSDEEAHQDSPAKENTAAVDEDDDEDDEDLSLVAEDPMAFGTEENLSHILGKKKEKLGNPRAIKTTTKPKKEKKPEPPIDIVFDGPYEKPKPILKLSGITSIAADGTCDGTQKGKQQKKSKKVVFHAELCNPMDNTKWIPCPICKKTNSRYHVLLHLQSHFEDPSQQPEFSFSPSIIPFKKIGKKKQNQMETQLEAEIKKSETYSKKFLQYYERLQRSAHRGS